MGIWPSCVSLRQKNCALSRSLAWPGEDNEIDWLKIEFIFRRQSKETELSIDRFSGAMRCESHQIRHWDSPVIILIDGIALAFTPPQRV